jgi:exosortase N
METSAWHHKIQNILRGPFFSNFNSKMASIKPKFIPFLLVGYAVLIAVAFRNFLRFDATFFLGVAVLPTLFFAEAKKTARSVFWLAPFFILTIISTSYTLFYFAIIGALIYFYSQKIGKISILPVALLLTISPVFSYLTDVFSFDLRLKLTAFAVEILKKIAPNNAKGDPSVSDAFLGNFQAIGNIIRLPNGEEWQIDAACMGLNMLSIGLILTYFFIGFFAKKVEKLPTIKGTLSLVFAAIMLNLLSNLMRIMAVVLLHIPPETVGHELIGLLSFGVYSIVPIYFLIKKTTQISFFFHEKINNQAFGNACNQLTIKDLKLPIFIFILLLTRAVLLDFYKKEAPNLVLSSTTTADFTVVNLPNGVTQLKNDSTLIYLKNLQHGFVTEHSPMICWRGSGYEFQKIEETKIGNTPVYIGILQRDTDQIHAVWWFESDNFATNDQIEWRFRAFTEGSSFRVVNVNAASRERALAAAKRWLRQ